MTDHSTIFKKVKPVKTQRGGGTSSHLDEMIDVLRDRTSRIYAILLARRDQLKTTFATATICAQACKNDKELQDDVRALRTLARRQIEKHGTGELRCIAEIDASVAESMLAEDIVAAACRNLGVIHLIAGRWSKALAVFQRSLILFEKVENKTGLVQTYNEMAILYIKRGFWDKAYDCHSKSLELANASGDLKLKGDVVLSRAEQFLMMSDFKLAEQHSRIALSIFESLKDILRKARTYNVLGTIYTRLGKKSDAREFFEKSIRTCRTGADDPALVDSYRRYADFHMASGSPKQALKCLEFSFLYAPA